MTTGSQVVTAPRHVSISIRQLGDEIARNLPAAIREGIPLLGANENTWNCRSHRQSHIMAGKEEKEFADWSCCANDGLDSVDHCLASCQFWLGWTHSLVMTDRVLSLHGKSL